MLKNKYFLERIQGKNGVTEISNLHENLGGLEKYDELIEGGDELYFLSFLSNGTWRAYKEHKQSFRTSDHHVAGTTCFKVDFDVRANVYKDTGNVISHEELMDYLPALKEGLKSNPLLSDFNAIIFSGNGFHVYWIGQPVLINSETYYGAAKYLLNIINEIFADQPALLPDQACTNIARLMRLPGSFNKKTKYGLPPQEVTILEMEDGDSELVGKLPELGELFYKQKEEEIKDELIKMKDTKIDRCGLKNCPHLKYQIPGGFLFEPCELYVSINHDINIADLVREYTGRELAKNGKNFISNKDGGFTGAFVVPEKNIVVWCGTPHFKDTYTVYSPFAFIMVHYANGDKAKTFEWAKNRYPHLSHIKTKFYFGKGRYNDRN